jgi:hypothetical protein
MPLTWDLFDVLLTFMGFGEKDHRDKVPLLHYSKGIASLQYNSHANHLQ